MNKKVLIVDAESDISDLISVNLRLAGFTVVTAETASVGLQMAQSERPNLILLDLMRPEPMGLEVCRTLKRDPGTRGIPVIMVSAKSEAVDRVTGFENGATDYVSKPFSPRELVLRVQSVLRRGAAKYLATERLQLGVIRLDRTRHEAYVEERLIDLTSIEFKLLAGLMERKGRAHSRERLLKEVWGYENTIDTRTIDTHVRRLREKLGKYATYVETVRNVGYRISDPDEQ